MKGKRLWNNRRWFNCTYNAYMYTFTPSHSRTVRVTTADATPHIHTPCNRDKTTKESMKEGRRYVYKRFLYSLFPQMHTYTNILAAKNILCLCMAIFMRQSISYSVIKKSGAKSMTLDWNESKWKRNQSNGSMEARKHNQFTSNIRSFYLHLIWVLFLSIWEKKTIFFLKFCCTSNNRRSICSSFLVLILELKLEIALKFVIFLNGTGVFLVCCIKQCKIIIVNESYDIFNWTQIGFIASGIFANP